MSLLLLLNNNNNNTREHHPRDLWVTVLSGRRLKSTGTSFVGMDAEWKPRGRHRVALLQLATVDGFCLLIQFHRLVELAQCIPHELMVSHQCPVVHLVLHYLSPYILNETWSDGWMGDNGSGWMVRVASQQQAQGRAMGHLSRACCNTNHPLDHMTPLPASHRRELRSQL